ncbi:MAG: hypothetical protein ACYCX4_13415, partial [Bacillota bacterium]
MDRQEIQLVCRPVIMDAVCSTGIKCFRNTHYLSEDSIGNCIPDDAFIINCRVNQLEVTSALRVGECYRLKVNYRIRIWYEYIDITQSPTDREVTFTEKDVKDLSLMIPADDCEGGCQ